MAISNMTLPIIEAKNKLSGVTVRVKGIITCLNKRIFLEDNSAAIEISNIHSEKSLMEGDMVEVTGILHKNTYNIQLKKCNIKNLEKQKEVIPVVQTIEELLNENTNNFKLITINNVKLKSFTDKDKAIAYDDEGNELCLNIPFKISSFSREAICDVTGVFCNEKKPYIYVRGYYDIKEKSLQNSLSFYPSNFSSTFLRNPEITVKSSQDLSIYNLDKCTLTLNGTLTKFIVTSSSIKHIPLSPLPFGENHVEVQLVDSFNKSWKYCWSFFILNKEQKYRFYYGVPHCHTSYSDGKGTVITASDCARKNKLDFIITSEHSPSLLRAESTNFSKWKASINEAEAYNKKHRDFLSLVGFELSSSVWGHINIINAKTLVNRRRASMQDLTQWLQEEKNAILTVNHPFRVKKNISYSPEMDNYFNLMEVGNGAPPRRYVRTLDEFYSALDEGWHFGAVNGQDNHSDNWGVSDNVTAVISEHLNVSSFMEAFKARRVYSTESKSLKFLFKANNHWMGSIIDIPSGEAVEFLLAAEDKHNPIEKFQLISNNGTVVFEKSFGGVRKAEWKLKLVPNHNYRWFVSKIVHIGDRISLSSPIFINIIEP